MSSTVEMVRLKDGSEATMTTVPMIPGDAGVSRTMHDMADFVRADFTHPNITTIAKKLRRTSDAETAYATFKWLVDNHEYHTDGAHERLTSPWITVDKNSPYKAFDCDDMSMLIAALLEANGIHTAFKAIAWRTTTPPEQFTHVYLLAKLADGWLPLDPVMGLSGYGNERSPIFRSMIVPVEIHGSGLSDLVDPREQFTPEIIGKEVTQRIFDGENVGDVVEDVVKRVCIAGVKYEIAKRRPMLIAGGIGIATAFITIGFFFGKSKRRKR